jgi:hypothetical protein
MTSAFLEADIFRLRPKLADLYFSVATLLAEQLANPPLPPPCPLGSGKTHYHIFAHLQFVNPRFGEVLQDPCRFRRVPVWDKCPAWNGGASGDGALAQKVVKWGEHPRPGLEGAGKGANT